MSETSSATPRSWRICFCNTSTSWGGGEHWHLTFAREMQARGWQTQLLAARGGVLAGRARKAGLQLREIPAGRLSFLHPLRMLELLRHFQQHKPHALVLGLPQDVKAAGQMARQAGVPLVLYRRGMGLPVRDTAFNRHLFRNVLHGVLVNALDTRRALLADNPELLPPERIHLLRNGVNEALLERKPAPFPDPEPFIVGTAGRLVKQKGHGYLLKAVALLRQQGLDLRVRIAGEGPLRDTLQSLALSLDVADVVEFVGFVPDMETFYDGLHVFAFPSLWEGMGNAVLEAMARARPVVGFAVSSMPEVVRHGETGLLTPEKDVEGLAGALRQLYSKPSLRLSMGLAGRERVRREFLLQDKLLRFEALLQAGLADMRDEAAEL